MTEQEQLSERYSELKVRYWELLRVSGNCQEIMNHNEVLKDKNQVLRNKNTELAEKRQKLETKNNELTRRIHELEKLIDNLDDGKVLKLKKTDVSGMYVTLSRYQKMCKLAEQSAAKVCDLSRENETLKRMIKPTEV